MSRVIRIDEDVWAELKNRAEPFEDTPNDVLRKLLGLKDKGAKGDGTMSGLIQRGQSVDSKPALVELLSRWLRRDERTIGDVGSFGGKPWLYVELGADTVQINADTTRDGVERFLRLHGQGHEQWYIVPNSRGVANKVTNEPSRRPIRGLYMYVSRPGERVL